MSEGQSGTFRTGLVALDAATPALLAEWRLLEDRAVSGNAFLSPNFVVPAHQYLDTTPSPVVAFVHRIDLAGPTLVALGAFSVERASLQVPLAHLASFQCCHTFSSGMLVDRDRGAENLVAMLRFLLRAEHPWRAIDFSLVDLSNEFGELLRSVLDAERIKWHERSGHFRAMVDFRRDGNPAERIPASVRKELARKRRKLEALGKVESRLLIPEPGDRAPMERFLALEHAGWKGDRGSSLLSQDTHKRFFDEMTRGFSERGRAVFCELLLGGEVIASSSNYVSGRSIFAFKIGWNPEFARFSPGLLAELAIIEHLPVELPGVHCLDSGSAPGSYVERLWLERNYLSQGTIATSRTASRVLALANLLRRIRSAGRRLLAGLRTIGRGSKVGGGEA